MRRVDVAVIGGGPAGSSCATKLARLGFDVTLIEKGERTRQHRGESLPSSVSVVFDDLSLSLPEDVIIARPPRHLVYWGEARGDRVVNQEHSFLVWRGPFDDHLRRHAHESRVALVDAVVVGAERVADGFEVAFDASSLTCRVLVDASGRSGVLAKELREREPRFRTLALTAHFRTDEDDPPTLVESFASGWAWSAPIRGGVRDVTLMVERPADFHETLALAEHVHRLVDGAPQIGEVRGVDATPYRARRFYDQKLILAGDAGSFLDPLAAHGVHKAMDSGVVAAVVARTILEHPEREADAAEFFERREGDIYRVTSERLRGLYAQETRYRDCPFWKKRSHVEASPPPSPSPISLTPDMKLRLAPDVEIADAPVLEDDLIERLPVLRSPRHERAVRYFGGVCLPELVDAIERATTLEAARIANDDARRAVDWLYRSGYLVE